MRDPVLLHKVENYGRKTLMYTYKLTPQTHAHTLKIQNKTYTHRHTQTHTESHFYYKEKDPISMFIYLVGFQGQQGLPRAISFI